jgi:hypothetical protein
MGNQHPDDEFDHRKHGATAGHNARVVRWMTWRAVYGALIFGAIGAGPAPAREPLLLSATQGSAELAEDRGRGDPPAAAVSTSPAAATLTERSAFTSDQGAFSTGEIPPSDAPPDIHEPWSEPEPNAVRTEPWGWQVLPDGTLYPSYLAGPKEPRFASVWNHDPHYGWMLDLEAGGRVGLLRYGTEGRPRPDGWELDLEGAAFPRLDLDHEEDLISADFRVGVPLTFGLGPWRMKLAVYHLSSHLGDEFQLRFPEVPRINYSRNALVLGGAYYLRDDLCLYAEAEWAFYTDGGTQPWEFQFGLDYSPVRWAHGSRGAPFLALNGQLREEVDYGGSFVAQAGWQWRGNTNHRFRVGLQYFAGKSDQYQFYRRHEDKVGVGMWYDF